MTACFLSSIINMVRTHRHPADGDPAVERAVVDPIGRLGRVALPPVCAVGGGLDITPSSAIFCQAEIPEVFTRSLTGGAVWCALFRGHGAGDVAMPHRRTVSSDRRDGSCRSRLCATRMPPRSSMPLGSIRAYLSGS